MSHGSPQWNSKRIAEKLCSEMTQSMLEKPKVSFSDSTLSCNDHLSRDVVWDFGLDVARSNLV